MPGLKQLDTSVPPEAWLQYHAIPHVICVDKVAMG
jgi:hypothetical protein